MKKNLKFRVKNPAHSEAIQRRLFDLGYRWWPASTTVEHTEKSFLYANEGGAIRHSSNKEDHFFENEPHKESTLEELFDELKEIRVKLNSEYEAIVGEGVITVGCQNIEFERVEALWEAVCKQRGLPEVTTKNGRADLIQQLRDGEIAILNDIEPDQMADILEKAFGKSDWLRGVGKSGYSNAIAFSHSTGEAGWIQYYKRERDFIEEEFDALVSGKEFLKYI